jgi:hypothetical protein
MGTIAEFVAVNSELVAKKPTNSSFEEAAGLVGLTSIQALESVGIKENDRVLIHAGSGGVGSFAIQCQSKRGYCIYKKRAALAKQSMRMWRAWAWCGSGASAAVLYAGAMRGVKSVCAMFWLCVCATGALASA